MRYFFSLLVITSSLLFATPSKEHKESSWGECDKITVRTTNCALIVGNMNSEAEAWCRGSGGVQSINYTGNRCKDVESAGIKACETKARIKCNGTNNSTTANVNTPTRENCIPRHNLNALGYDSGHKTRYCISEGYDGYKPKTNICIRDCNVKQIRQPLKNTKYSGGHKTKHCIKKGFSGYQPISGGDKYPWGYCTK